MGEEELPPNLGEDNLSEETKTLISSLVSDKDSVGKLCNYQGCWNYYNTLQGVVNQPLSEAVLDSHALAYASSTSQGFYLQDCVHFQEFERRVGVVLAFQVQKSREKKVKRSITLESTFDSFCNGVHFFGPFWENVMSYWRGSLEDPKHVLFMRYEDLKVEPHGQIKRLAQFLGCPFSREKEDSGHVDKILKLCFLRNLSSLEINKTGKTSNGEPHSCFFRKGIVGDWKNHLTREMENKINNIVEEKFKGWGLKF